MRRTRRDVEAYFENVTTGVFLASSNREVKKVVNGEPHFPVFVHEAAPCEMWVVPFRSKNNGPSTELIQDLLQDIQPQWVYLTYTNWVIQIQPIQIGSFHVRVRRYCYSDIVPPVMSILQKTSIPRLCYTYKLKRKFYYIFWPRESIKQSHRDFSSHWWFLKRLAIPQLFPNCFSNSWI